jgi:hypothetical protein
MLGLAMHSGVVRGFKFSLMVIACNPSWPIQAEQQPEYLWFANGMIQPMEIEKLSLKM